MRPLSELLRVGTCGEHENEQAESRKRIVLTGTRGRTIPTATELGPDLIRSVSHDTPTRGRTLAPTRSRRTT